MPTYSLKRTQLITTDLDTAWVFFNSPDNLQAITPNTVTFKIISPQNGQPVYAGQLIEYTIRPLFGIPLYWMTEITHVAPRRYFVDEQRYGPYAFWHHQHHFREVQGGVEMTDIVNYRIGLGVLGRLANRLHVKNHLVDIFDYRYKRIEEIFKT